MREIVQLQTWFQLTMFIKRYNATFIFSKNKISSRYSAMSINESIPIYLIKNLEKNITLIKLLELWNGLKLIQMI